MADVTDELKQLNDNATELLAKYDGVFQQLSDESQEQILAIAQKGEDGLNAIQELLDNGNVATAENALKFSGKTLDEVVQYVADNAPKPVTTVSTFDIFGDGSAVALYQLDGNANDTGGNYDGIATSVTYGSGKFGQAAVFNGASRIELGKSLLGGASSQWSYSGWVKAISAIAQWGGYILFRNQQHLVFRFLDTGISLYWYDGSQYTHDIPNTNFVGDNTYHHIVHTYDGTTVKTYVDNTLVDSTDMTFNPFNGSNWIGGEKDSDYQDHTSDQVRIFNRALTATEVNTLYNEGQ